MGEKMNGSKREGYSKDYNHIREEDLESVINDFGPVSEPDLEKSISEIIEHLTPGSKNEFGLFKNIIPLGLSLVGLNKNMIIINIEAKRMLEDEESKSILYTTIAHEIGHIIFMKQTYSHPEYTIAYKTTLEVEADKIALILLKEIYDNPKELLLKQIYLAFNKTLELEDVKKEEMALAIAFKEGREKALIGVD